MHAYIMHRLQGQRRLPKFGGQNICYQNIFIWRKIIVLWTDSECWGGQVPLLPP